MHQTRVRPTHVSLAGTRQGKVSRMCRLDPPCRRTRGLRCWRRVGLNRGWIILLMMWSACATGEPPCLLPAGNWYLNGLPITLTEPVCTEEELRERHGSCFISRIHKAGPFLTYDFTCFEDIIRVTWTPRTPEQP